jgi:polyhydroxyalkanoate synthesis regulator protein
MDKDADTVVVKRYADRRFYDTTSLRYVTVESLRDMAGAGIALVIYDAGTGESLTHTVLAPLH